MMNRLTDDEARRVTRLSQEMINLLMDHEAKVCQAAIITVAAIGCMVEAEGNTLRAYGLAEKLCLDIKEVLKTSIIMEEPDEDGAGLRD